MLYKFLKNKNKNIKALSKKHHYFIKTPLLKIENIQEYFLNLQKAFLKTSFSLTKNLLYFEFWNCVVQTFDIQKHG